MAGPDRARVPSRHRSSQTGRRGRDVPDTPTKALEVKDSPPRAQAIETALLDALPRWRDHASSPRIGPLWTVGGPTWEPSPTRTGD